MCFFFLSIDKHLILIRHIFLCLYARWKNIRGVDFIHVCILYVEHEWFFEVKRDVFDVREEWCEKAIQQRSECVSIKKKRAWKIDIEMKYNIFDENKDILLSGILYHITTQNMYG